MARRTIVGFDLGSTNIHLVVAHILGDTGKIEILIGITHPARGIRRGVIVDMDDATESIKDAFKQLGRGVRLDSSTIITSINGSHIGGKTSRGVVAIARADGEVSQEDMNRALEAAQTFSLPPNREIIHNIPKEYTVDQERGIENPLGMTGVRLEVDALIIEAFSPFLKNLHKVMERAAIATDNLVYAPLAGSLAVLTKKQKELGVMYLDVGGNTTSLAIHEEGRLLHVRTLPIGAAHITNDLAIGFRIPIDVAEKLKIRFGAASKSYVKKDENIDLLKLGLKEGGKVARFTVAEIIESRVAEIFELANKELASIDREKLLPAGVVIGGAGAKLPGMAEVAKETFGLPTQLGYPQNVEGLIEETNDPAYVTAIGLLQWSKLGLKDTRSGHAFTSSPMFGRIREWVRNLLP